MTISHAPGSLVGLDRFAGPTDFAYLPLGATAALSSRGGGRFALCGARAHRRLPVRHLRRHR